MPGISKRTSDISQHQSDGSSCCLNPLMGGNGKTTAFPSGNESPVSDDGFWSKHRGAVSYNQLEKFWCDLNPQARRNLLRLDKQTLFEHARKNMYCSRCNGLLLEGFVQIVMSGKTLQHETEGVQSNETVHNSQNNGELCTSNVYQDDAQDPSIHPWGGLTTSSEGTLTLLDCYLYSKSLKGLQNVFDSARARERERELLYPDACGGGGRGWISQGTAGYSRGHGTRETCALHTARLSVETLVDFWSALGDETRQSLLKMKEDDFIERLMYRFDSKKFCRECRRNVIREFKELKELKRMKREPRCTSRFCVADTAIQYEVSCDAVQADWHQTYSDTIGRYHHFEWAIGTGEGKSDILEFEDVGLNDRVHANGLDFSGLDACYITLRAWKIDGRCNEISVKAHALRDEQCVHCRLGVGDGFVTISRGDSITRFFEHAEEAEEEEDDDSMDNDDNELDGECSRPQKHAKSPELAREFLLDAATVIFKEQIEKAFREGTARQNAHSIFVCLALKVLEERVHVACKEIVTLEKQMKLLEEEENEKRKEDERKERRRIKEREKKLRRKERLREKDNREEKYADSRGNLISTKLLATSAGVGAHNVSVEDSVCETCEVTPSSPLSPDIQDDQLLTGKDFYWNMEGHSEAVDCGDFGNMRDSKAMRPYGHLMCSRRKLKFRNDPHHDLDVECPDRGSYLLSENGSANAKYGSRYPIVASESKKQLRSSTPKPDTRNVGAKFQCDCSSSGDRYDSFACSCEGHEYQSRTEPVATRVVRQHKYVQKPYYHGRNTPVEINGRFKSKITAGNPTNTKKVWEPLDSRKKHTCIGAVHEADTSVSDQLLESSCSTISAKTTNIFVQTNDKENDFLRDLKMNTAGKDIVKVSHPIVATPMCLEEKVLENGELCSAVEPREGIPDPSISGSDNCSSCHREGDINTDSTLRNLESSPIVGGNSSHEKKGLSDCERITKDQNTTEVQLLPISAEANISGLPSSKSAALNGNGSGNVNLGAQMHNQNLRHHFPVFQAPPTMGYRHQVPWRPTTTSGLMDFPHSSQYLCFPNMFGYSLSANAAAFMQYGAASLPTHMAPPPLTHAHLPVFQPPMAHQAISTKERAKVCVPPPPNVGGGSTADQKIPAPTTTTDTAAAIGGRKGKSDGTTADNDFSLFHFGGPVALSTGYKKLNPFQGKAVGGGDTFLNSCERPKEPVEEYNLFAAASNGFTFSFS